MCCRIGPCRAVLADVTGTFKCPTGFCTAVPLHNFLRPVCCRRVMGACSVAVGCRGRLTTLVAALRGRVRGLGGVRTGVRPRGLTVCRGVLSLGRRVATLGSSVGSTCSEEGRMVIECSTGRARKVELRGEECSLVGLESVVMDCVGGALRRGAGCRMCSCRRFRRRCGT